MLYEFEEITDVVGCCCTLLIPYLVTVKAISWAIMAKTLS